MIDQQEYSNLLAQLRRDLFITFDGLHPDVAAALVPRGAWLGYSSASPLPDGYLRQDGSARLRTDLLFRVIGTTFGAGDGSTTYNLPNIANTIIRL